MSEDLDLTGLNEEDAAYVVEMATKMDELIDYQKKHGRYEWSLNDFEIGSSLGRGKFGRVFLAREKRTHFMVAIKVLMKSEISRSNVECQVLREIEIQSKLRHPNILHFFTFFHDSRKIYLVLEYAALGELFGHLRRANTFCEPTAAKFIYQVADALHYCHLNSVIHRDLKPENLLVNVVGDVKLADFGWSVHAPSNRRKTMCGTLDYLPPEMVKRNEHTNYVDNWCLGILCYEFLTGFTPFETDSQDKTFKRIVNMEYKFPSKIPEGGKDLISKLLRLTPQQRMSLPDVMSHPWIQKYKTHQVKPDKNGYIK
ncbi:hypothetical protein R5R35_010459 [Gryllus longicercus]|uniref:Aurora kinase n=1 Tax=Gryllus longicercus TaxID=2509291 RepID=A0AAN9ZEE0_9ORTH